MHTYYFVMIIVCVQQPKCHQYWPSNVDESADYGNISVTLLQENVLSDYTIRKFVLKMVC